MFAWSRDILNDYLADLHEEIAALHDQLGNEETRGRAAQMLRTLVERIELAPNGDELAIVLRGDLAAIVTFACGKENPTFLEETAVLEELIGPSKVTGLRTQKASRGRPTAFCDIVV
jgi:hypothetical protein